MRALKSNKVFVSAYRTDRSDEANRAAHEQAFKVLSSGGYKFGVVRGSYKGALELSFVLLADDVVGHQRNLDVALDLARLNSQESILEVHNDDTADLIHLGNGVRTERLGTFKAVSELEASKHDAFTYEPKTNQYYVVE